MPRSTSARILPVRAPAERIHSALATGSGPGSTVAVVAAGRQRALKQGRPGGAGPAPVSTWKPQASRQSEDHLLAITAQRSPC